MRTHVRAPRLERLGNYLILWASDRKQTSWKFSLGCLEPCDNGPRQPVQWHVWSAQPIGLLNLQIKFFAPKNPLVVDFLRAPAVGWFLTNQRRFFALVCALRKIVGAETCNFWPVPRSSISKSFCFTVTIHRDNRAAAEKIWIGTMKTNKISWMGKRNNILAFERNFQ